MAIAGACVAGLIVMLAVFAVDYAAAPAIVPTHFGLSGAADAWGPKSTFVIFPALGFVFTIVSFAMPLIMARSRRPTPPPLVSLLGQLVFAEVTWVLVVAEISTFDIALGRSNGLGPGFFVGIAAVLVTSLAMIILAMRWRASL